MGALAIMVLAFAGYIIMYQLYGKVYRLENFCVIRRSQDPGR